MINYFSSRYMGDYPETRIRQIINPFAISPLWHIGIYIGKHLFAFTFTNDDFTFTSDD